VAEFASRWLSATAETCPNATDETDKSPSVSFVSPVSARIEPQRQDATLRRCVACGGLTSEDRAGKICFICETWGGAASPNVRRGWASDGADPVPPGVCADCGGPAPRDGMHWCAACRAKEGAAA
jgi:hypothetical protein